MKEESGDERLVGGGMEEGKGVRRAARASVDGVRAILQGGERGRVGERGMEGDVRMRVQLAVPDDLDGIMAPDGKMFLLEVRLAGRQACGQAGRLVGRQPGRHVGRQAGRHVGRQAGSVEVRLAGRPWTSLDVCECHPLP